MKIQLTSLFRHTPALRWFEVVPAKYSSPMLGYDNDFPLDDFCAELADALESPYAKDLTDLRLDFSGLEGPVRQAISQRLTDAIAKRAVLRHVSVTWPT